MEVHHPYCGTCNFRIWLVTFVFHEKTMYELFLTRITEQVSEKRTVDIHRNTEYLLNSTSTKEMCCQSKPRSFRGLE